MRHANSRWNAAFATIISELKEGKISEAEADLRKRKVFQDPDLVDCSLTPFGVKQATDCEISQFDSVTTVLVSPMRRCLETAHLIFSRHPNFE